MTNLLAMAAVYLEESLPEVQVEFENLVISAP